MLEGLEAVCYLAYMVAYLRGIFPPSMFETEQLMESDAPSLAVGLTLNLKVLAKGKLSLIDAFIGLLESIAHSRSENLWIESLELNICQPCDQRVLESYTFELVDLTWDNVGSRMKIMRLTDAIIDLEHKIASYPSLPPSKSIMFRLRYAPDCPRCYQPELFQDGTNAPALGTLNVLSGAVEPLSVQVLSGIEANTPLDMASPNVAGASMQLHLEPSSEVKTTPESIASPRPCDKSISGCDVIPRHTPKPPLMTGRSKRKCVSTYQDSSTPDTSPPTMAFEIPKDLQDFLPGPFETPDISIAPAQSLPGTGNGVDILVKHCECGNTDLKGMHCFVCSRTLHYTCYAAPIDTNNQHPCCVTCYSTRNQLPLLKRLIRLRSLWYLIKASPTFPLIADSFSHLGLKASRARDTAIVASLWSRLFADEVVARTDDATLNVDGSSATEKWERFDVTIKGISSPHSQRNLAKGSQLLVRFVPETTKHPQLVWPVYLKYKLSTRLGGNSAIAYWNKLRGNHTNSKLSPSPSAKSSSICPNTTTGLTPLSQKIDQNTHVSADGNGLLTTSPLSLIVRVKLLHHKLTESISQPTFFDSHNPSLRLMSFEQSMDLLRQQSQTTANHESTPESHVRDIGTPLFLQPN